MILTHEDCVPCFPTRAPVMQALPSAHRRLTWHTHCSFADPEMGIFCLTWETAFTPDVQKGPLTFAGSVFEDKQKHPGHKLDADPWGLLACEHLLPAGHSKLSLSAHLLLIYIQFKPNENQNLLYFPQGTKKEARGDSKVIAQQGKGHISTL